MYFRAAEFSRTELLQLFLTPLNCRVFSGLFYYSSLFSKKSYFRAPTALCKMRENMYYAKQYTEYAGPEISVNSRIASLFSRQIANVTAGPVLALQPMGAKQYFHCNSFNIGLMHKL